MTASAGWILYDDSCGFCRRWVPFWEHSLLRHGFRIAPLQSSWVQARLEIPEGELLRAVRLLLPSGEVVSGADVYRYAMRRIWWARPGWFVASLPGFRHLFDLGYRLFALHRHQISDTCGISGQDS